MFSRGNLLISGLISLGVLTSCSSVREEYFKERLNQFKDLQPSSIYTKEKPILNVNLGNLLEKEDSLNHKLPNELNQFVEVRISEHPIYLKDIKFSFDDMELNLPIKVDKFVAYKQLPPLTLSGKLTDVLEQVAVLTDSYWSYENGVIVFRKYKNVIYRIPVENISKLDLVYNSGYGRDEKVDIRKIKDNLFDEIKNIAQTVVKDRYIEGKIERKLNIKSNLNLKKNSFKNKEDTVLKENNKERNTLNGANFENSLIKNKSNTNLKDNVDSISKESGVDNTKSRFRNNNRNLELPLNSIIVDVNSKEIKKENKSSKSYSKSSKSEDFQKWDVKKIKKDEKQAKNYKRTKNELNYDNNIVDETVIDISEKQVQPKETVAVSKDAGLIIARVSRKTEKILDKAIKNIVKKSLSQLVIIDIYVLETRFSDIRDASLSLSGFLKNKEEETSINIDGNALTLSFSSLADGLSKGFNLSSIAKILVSKGNGKILASPHIAVLPNKIATISSTVKIPYVEPQNISVGGTNSQLSYEIKSIDDGIKMTVLPIIATNNSVVLNLSVKANRYIGDKNISAGTLGTITVPIQSPRDLRTSLIVRAGDTFLLGGVKQKVISRDNSRQFGIIPQNDKFEDSNKTLFILGKVRLINLVGGDK